VKFQASSLSKQIFRSWTGFLTSCDFNPHGSSCSFAFLDINPLSKGHALVIPKCKSDREQGRFTDHSLFPDHAEKMHDLPDDNLRDILPIAKKIALAQGFPDYNVLQNNGRIAHQVFTLL
jgi:diadenosine tetraphosphate (Ap4A) HIT family hydrolase